MPAPDAATLLAWGRGLGLPGDAGEPRVRPWGTTVRLGPAWLKACGPGGLQEAPLVPALAGWGLPGALRPLAADPDAGRLALPDAGVPLRAVPGGADRWPELLEQHAALQRALQPRVPELLALGVPDARPASLPGLLDALRQRHPLPPPLHEAVDAAVPRLREDAAILADGPVAPSLQHDDLHGGNVLVAADGTTTVVDWGDAAVAHPFGVLLVTLRVLRHEGADEALVQRSAEAYLSAFADLASRAELQELAAAAQRVQALGRALCWERALSGADEAERAPFEDPVSGWLGVLAGVED